MLIIYYHSYFLFNITRGGVRYLSYNSEMKRGGCPPVPPTPHPTWERRRVARHPAPSLRRWSRRGGEECALLSTSSGQLNLIIKCPYASYRLQ